MTEVVQHPNPAEVASDRALADVYRCLCRKESFLVEAGAGAGKTYTLVKALRFLMDRYEHALLKRHQKIACITFTNVARDEIDARTDRSPLIYSDTIHGFCWSLIRGFQRQLREQLSELKYWPERIDEIGSLSEHTVEYKLGYRSIDSHRISLHHDDVLPLTVTLMENLKFRRIVASKYPYILIDEYQDTNKEWIKSIKTHFLGQEHSPLLGFFGDHWQKIYGNGCGRIDHPSLTVIGKGANFRSVSTIVDFLNRMRPTLPQFVVDPQARGSVRIFHTNTWRGHRRTGSHWAGDLPFEASEKAFQFVMDRLREDDWNLSRGTTKILMLTHRLLATEQGYPTLPSVFRYNDSFTKKEHPHIAYFADVLEPVCEAYRSRQFGEMFRILGSTVPAMRSPSEKNKWSKAMDDLLKLRDYGTVGNVVDHLLSVRRPRVPDAIDRRERELRQFPHDTDGEMSRVLKELSKLRAVLYKEIIVLCRYLSGHSPFETKHGVKGAEFENVLVVVGRGWNQYNFNRMLELAMKEQIPANQKLFFERNRNLFYVTCSRPKRRLSILFTQQLSVNAMRTISNWFGDDAIEAVRL